MITYNIFYIRIITDKYLINFVAIFFVELTFYLTSVIKEGISKIQQRNNLNIIII